MRWMRWHCPSDTWFEIRALVVWGRARYLSVTEVPHNIETLQLAGKKHVISFKLEGQSGARDLRLSMQAASTTAPGLPPNIERLNNISTSISNQLQQKQQQKHRLWHDTELRRGNDKQYPEGATSPHSSDNNKYNLHVCLVRWAHN